MSYSSLSAPSCSACSRAFLSEVETGSRQENASNQESRARFDSIETEKALGLRRHNLNFGARRFGPFQPPGVFMSGSKIRTTRSGDAADGEIPAHQPGYMWSRVERSRTVWPKRQPRARMQLLQACEVGVPLCGAPSACEQ